MKCFNQYSYLDIYIIKEKENAKKNIFYILDLIIKL